MTKNQIKALVAELIDGQGNQVDIGSVLPDVLYAIIDNMVPAEFRVTFEAEGTAGTGYVDHAVTNEQDDIDTYINSIGVDAEEANVVVDGATSKYLCAQTILSEDTIDAFTGDNSTTGWAVHLSTTEGASYVRFYGEE